MPIAKAKISRRILLEAARIVNRGDILYMRMLENHIVRAAVRGRSDIYIVTVDVKTGRAYCTCPAYMYKGICKHVVAVKIYLKSLLSKEVRSASQSKPPSSHNSERVVFITRH